MNTDNNRLTNTSDVEAPDKKQFKELNEHDIAYQKEQHQREAWLFKYACTVIGWMFIFAGILALGIVVAVFKGASPWLITLASIALLTPAALLGGLFHHTYSKDTGQDVFKGAFEQAPVISLFKNMLDVLKELLAAKK